MPTTIPLLAFCLLVGACMSVELRTIPEGAQVIGLSDTLGERKILGQTPLTISSSDLKSLSRDDVVYIELKLSGYRAENLFIPLSFFGEMNIQTSLAKEETLDEIAINDASNQTLNIYQAIVRDDVDGAEKLLRAAEGKYQDLSALHILRAILQIKAKNITAAIETLRRAENLSPNDQGVKVLIRQLELNAKGNGGGSEF